jgi:ribosomal subunit interface protein
MDIRVSGHQTETGTALQGHVEDRLQAIADKYFSRTISANVTFGKGPHDNGFTCDIMANVMKGTVLKAHHDAHDATLSFNGAADKIEKQLRRYMRRLNDKKGNGAEEIEAIEAGYTVFQANDDAEEAAEHMPIIAETRVDVPEASVGDAVMMLDLRHTNAMLFKNSGTGYYNMVYRRGDGTIGWVEPARA